MSEAFDRQYWDQAAKSGNYVQAITGQSDVGVYDQRGLYDAGRLEQLLPGAAGLTLLEWGCGAGRVTQYLDGLFKHIIAVDISAEMLKIVAGLSLLHTETHQITGNVLPVPDGSVDAVYSYVTWMHLPDRSSMPKILAECKRVLKPAGKVVFQLPVYDTTLDRSAAWPGGVTSWTPAEMATLLEGWTVISLETNPGAHAVTTFGSNHFAYHVIQAPVAAPSTPATPTVK